LSKGAGWGAKGKKSQAKVLMLSVGKFTKGKKERKKKPRKKKRRLAKPIIAITK